MQIKRGVNECKDRNPMTPEMDQLHRNVRNLEEDRWNINWGQVAFPRSWWEWCNSRCFHDPISWPYLRLSCSEGSSMSRNDIMSSSITVNAQHAFLIIEKDSESMRILSSFRCGITQLKTNDLASSIFCELKWLSSMWFGWRFSGLPRRVWGLHWFEPSEKGLKPKHSGIKQGLPACCIAPWCMVEDAAL